MHSRRPVTSGPKWAKSAGPLCGRLGVAGAQQRETSTQSAEHAAKSTQHAACSTKSTQSTEHRAQSAVSGPQERDWKRLRETARKLISVHRRPTFGPTFGPVCKCGLECHWPALLRCQRATWRVCLERLPRAAGRPAGGVLCVPRRANCPPRVADWRRKAARMRPKLYPEVWPKLWPWILHGIRCALSAPQSRWGHEEDSSAESNSSCARNNWTLSLQSSLLSSSYASPASSREGHSKEQFCSLASSFGTQAEQKRTLN